MSHSVTFHCVYFEFSTVPKRETLKGVDLESPLHSFPVFDLIPEQNIVKNRKKSIRSIAIFSQMKKSI